MSQSILVVDDDVDVLSALNMLLKTEGFIPVTVDTPETALQKIRGTDFDLILIDLNFSLDTTSGDEGLKLIGKIRQLDDWVPVVVMTGWGTIAVAVEAMKAGGNDFIQKPWNNDRLITTIRNQLRMSEIQKESRKLSRHNQLLREQIQSGQEIVAESAAIKKVLMTIQQVADSDLSVSFTGENGTGKSLFASHLHHLSPRNQSAMITVNMGSITESLFESEMFGHVKGAFTDAKSARIGRFELADKGTLFLDEIANTPISQQGKLLRVLEEAKFEKVGSAKTQSTDFRLISATNSDLKKAVEQGQFRKDLLYRINSIEIEIPPLRSRVDDIMPLARAFQSALAAKRSTSVLSFDADAEEALIAYSWPGNVRELSHVMERAQILCRSGEIGVRDLGLDSSENVKGEAMVIGQIDDSCLRSMAEIEAEAVESRMRYFQGDANQAARSLGLSRSAFYRRLGKSKQSTRSERA